MKLIWRGKYTNPNQLAKVELPIDAVKFKEPDNPLMLNVVASLFSIPIFILVLICIYIKVGEVRKIFEMINLWGMLLAFVMIIPHEILHALAFPKEAKVDVWYSLINMMAFVHSTVPTSKKRFIFLCLLPNIVFGLIPFLIWLLIPNEMVAISSFIFSFSILGLFFGIGDYLNAFNAATQMPKEAVTQLSGFNSYWYLPK